MEIPTYPDECKHGGRSPRECDACEVERLRGLLTQIARLAHRQEYQEIVDLVEAEGA